MVSSKWHPQLKRAIKLFLWLYDREKRKKKKSWGKVALLRNEEWSSLEMLWIWNEFMDITNNAAYAKKCVQNRSTNSSHLTRTYMAGLPITKNKNKKAVCKASCIHRMCSQDGEWLLLVFDWIFSQLATELLLILCSDTWHSKASSSPQDKLPSRASWACS